MSSLSTKRLRFVEEYLVDLNGTQAAIRAGYSAGAANVTGSRLLANANVAHAITARRSTLSKRLEVSAEKVLSELAKIGFANVGDFYRLDGRGNLVVDIDALSDPEKAAAIAQMEVQTGADGSQTIKLKLADKKCALVELGKHLGLFQSKIEVPVERQDTLDSPRNLAMALLATIHEGLEVERRAAQAGPALLG